ncbi:MAG: glucose-6-phosphate 1-dehydrogenase [Ilumatobacteraceae bacterium]|nr:glucose-6-phosphate 1-dehydrogenase [Ilumatobacteraceae bacterium]
MSDPAAHGSPGDESWVASPTIIVLFGATGDLAARMVLPAVHAMAGSGLLPDDWALVGNGRGTVSDDDFRGHVRDALRSADVPVAALEGDAWQRFSERLFFAGGGFGVDDPATLLTVLDDVRQRFDMADAHLLHYLALPPTTFAPITAALGKHGLAHGARVVYEKPFGTSLAGFGELDDAVHAVLDEEQVHRIDHFLGKEAAQDLHALRFANGLFAGMWSREHVRAVQIDVPEELDVSDRVTFYDQTGAFRDMIVTHLFQLAAEVAMEPPVSMAPDDLRDARESVIAAFRPLDPDDVVLGQFDGYRDLDGVADGSTTDTFAAARLWIDTDRWHGVPFLLRTGKRMAAGAQQVSLLLRGPDLDPFGHGDRAGNVLVFSLAGDGAVELRIRVKTPGPGLDLTSTSMRLVLDDVRGGSPLPPYARLIHDVLAGDRSLFTDPEGLRSAWQTAERVLQATITPDRYEPGSWGPARADELAAPDGWLLER